MVEYASRPLDAVFHALADPTRRGFLARLAKRTHSVGELAAPLEMSLAAASKHIKVLEQAGLIRRTVIGRTHHCELDARPMHAGVEWLKRYERYWTQSLDTLEQLLRTEAASAPRRNTRRKR
jgi:DNA-binding transcriptional ArsR family regulator